MLKSKQQAFEKRYTAYKESISQDDSNTYDSESNEQYIQYLSNRLMEVEEDVEELRDGRPESMMSKRSDVNALTEQSKGMVETLMKARDRLQDL